MTKAELQKTISILKAAEKELRENNLDGERVSDDDRGSWHFEYSYASKILSDARWRLELKLNSVEAEDIFFK